MKRRKILWPWTFFQGCFTWAMGILLLLVGGAALAGERDLTYLLFGVGPFFLVFMISSGWMLRRMISNPKPAVLPPVIESGAEPPEPERSDAIRSIEHGVNTEPKKL